MLSSTLRTATALNFVVISWFDHDAFMRHAYHVLDAPESHRHMYSQNV